MSSSIINPFKFFTDSSGNALDSGYVYVGQVSLNPEVFPVQVYWDQSLTTPAAQPIRTIAGYPSRNGTPAQVYTSSNDYSIVVKDKNKEIVFIEMSANGLSGLAGDLANSSDPSKGSALIGRADQIVSNVAELRGLLKTSASKFATTLGYYVKGDVGGADYWLDVADTTSADNGGSIIVASDGGRWKLVHNGVVAIEQYGAKDDWNGSSGTNCLQAFNTILSDYPNGITVRARKTVGGTGVFLVNGNASSADMSKYIFDFDQDVSFYLIGTNTVLIGPGLRFTRPTSIRMSSLGYTYYLSSQPYGAVPSKPVTLTTADGESPLGERVITSAANEFQFKAVSLSTGALTDISATTDGNIANFGNISGTGFSVGSIAIRPGQEIQAQITLPSNPGKVCAYIETESGWVILAQDAAAGGSVTRYVFLEGFAIQVSTFNNPLSDNPAYDFGVSQVGIKVHGTRSFSILMNNIEVFRMDEQVLTSDILRAGWGAGLVSNTNPAYISYPVRIRYGRTYGMRQLSIVFVGDSTTDKINPFSMANHMVRDSSGAGGIQFKKILNQAVAGQTALQQRDIVNTTDYQALGGFDFMLIDVGINDIGGGSTPTDFVQAVVDIINRCATFNIIPIVGLPAMYYDQTAATPYGQTGQGTANARNGANYRQLLLRKLAELNVQVAQLPMQDMGAIVPSSLTNSLLDPVVQDNVHQSAYGAEQKGKAWAKALIGFLFNRLRKDIPFRLIKGGTTGWIPSAQQATFGNTAAPAFGIRGDQFYMGNSMNFPVGTSTTPAFGTKILQLPKAYAPEQQLFFNQPTSANTGGSASGPFTLSVQLRVDPDGSVYTQTPVVDARWVHFGGMQWTLKS